MVSIACQIMFLNLCPFRVKFLSNLCLIWAKFGLSLSIVWVKFELIWVKSESQKQSTSHDCGKKKKKVEQAYSFCSSNYAVQHRKPQSPFLGRYLWTTPEQHSKGNGSALSRLYSYSYNIFNRKKALKSIKSLNNRQHID